MIEEEIEKIINFRNDFLKLTNSNIYYTNSNKRILELSKSGLKELFKVDEIILRG